jgi:aminoglycoside phosphotransferase (APT) family kinase protein
MEARLHQGLPLRAPVEIIGARLQRRVRLAAARALVSRIAAGDPAVRAVCGPRPTIAHAELTSTDVAVILVSRGGEPPCAVLKLPMTPESVEGVLRESSTLAALHADDRLGHWRDLIPRPRASGELHGRRYRVDTVLRGRTVLDRLSDGPSRRRLLDSAAETIHVLHRESATTVEAGDRLVERWIDAPVDDLLARGAARGLEPGLERLRAELRCALVGRRFSVSWIHGDYWLGNLLFEDADAEPSGIVDWDAAVDSGLPVLDVLHLVVYTRRSVGGQNLGEIVSDLLDGGGWSPDERRILDRYGCCDGSLSERHAILLYWLRHVAHHACQQREGDRFAYRRWQAANVRPVLAPR